MKKSLSAMLVLCLMIGGIIAYNNNRIVDLGESDIPLGPGFQLDADSMKVLDDLAAVEQVVAELAGTDDVTVINHGTMAFVRSKKYGYRTSGMSKYIWQGTAGSVGVETGINITENQARVDIITGMTDQMSYINDPFSGSGIDFPHMVAVIDVLYTDNDEDALVEAYNDFLLTWGGDLETFLLDMNDYSDSSGKSDYESMYGFAVNTLGGKEQSYFSEEDYKADLDGVNIEQMMRRDGLLLSEAIKEYYLSGLFMEREALFVAAHGGQAAMEEAVRGFILGEVPEAYKDNEAVVRTLDGVESFNQTMRTMVYDQAYDPTDTSREAATDAFLAKVLQGSYVASRP